MEAFLGFVLKLVSLGLGFYTVRKIFNRHTKEFHFTIGHDGLKIDSTFYK